MSDQTGATGTAGRALQASPEALLDSLFESAEFGLALLDTDLRFVRLNPAMALIHGLPVGEHIGRTSAELLPGIGDRAAEAARLVVETGRAMRNLRVPVGGSPDGGLRILECSYYPVCEDEETRGVWASMRELTEERRTEQRRRAEGAAAGGETTAAVRERRALEQELESEHRIASQLQVSLMPDRLPAVPGVDIASAFRPAGDGHEIGGDFFDVFPMGSECWMLVIGDVCGKGAEAAALTALARYTLRAAAIQEGAEPAKLLAQLNEAVMRQRDDTRFLTAVCAFLEAGQEGDGVRVRLSVAGHPPPMRVGADGTVAPVGAMGMLLGIWEEPQLTEEVVRLDAGERLVLYTDGVVEAGAPRNEMGEAGLAAVLSTAAVGSAASTVAAIEGAVLARSATAPRDDIALLVLRPQAQRGP